MVIIMKKKCKKCEKLVDTMDIGIKGAYYNSKKEIVCYSCFKNELLDN